MNWTEEPATESQLKRLKEFGYEPERSLTKGEAAHLISTFEAHPEGWVALAARGLGGKEEEPEAFRLRTAVERARRAGGELQSGASGHSPDELDSAVSRREEFWLDTCRDIGKMASVQGRDLYRQFGCRFATPTHWQVHSILDALDSAMPSWDRDSPKVFYQTLELNFPELLRMRNPPG